MANEFIARKGLIVLTNGATITGSLNVQGNVNATGYAVSASTLTGSLFGRLTGTASFADFATTASYALTSAGVAANAVSSSYAQTASVANTASYVSPSGLPAGTISSSTQFNSLTAPFTGSFTGSHFGSLVGTSSWATTSSFAITASYAANATLPAGLISSSTQFKTLSDPFTGSFTGSFTGALTGTSSWATTASFATTANTVLTNTVSYTAGAGLSGGGSATLGGSSVTIDAVAGAGISLTAPTNDAINIDTGSAHFTGGVKNKLNTDGVISSSTQFTSLTAPFTGSFTGSHFGTLVGTSSFANTASRALGVVPNSVALGTDTTGNYAGDVTAGNGISVSGTAGEGTSFAVSLNTASAHFVTGARATISSANTVGASGINLTYNNLTGIISGTLVNSSVTVNGTAISLGGSGTVTANTTNALTFGNGLTGTSFNGSTAVTTAVDTGSAHFISGSRNSITFTDTAGASGIDFTYTNGTASAVLQNSSITVTAGNGLSGGGATSLGSTTTVSLNTSSAHFLDGVKKELNTEAVISGSVSSPSQGTITVGGFTNIDLGLQTGDSPNFTGLGVTGTTNSTLFNNGALIVSGGVGIHKDVNISGSLTVLGLLTATSMSTQYVTSSQYVVGTSRIILNDDDLVRFAGISIYDSGSVSPATASIYWDSLNHKFIYENLSGSSYNSAMFIAGPQNYDALGNEVGLTVGRIPVATGTDHIDSRVASSSIYIDFANKRTHIEAGLYVTGSVTASAGFTGSFTGDGSNLTGIVSNLNLTGSTSGTGTVALKTQSLTISGSNGITATVSGQTVTLSGSNATTTAKGVASFNATNFTVTGGEVTSNNITINGGTVTLGGTRNITLSEITAQGASTTNQVTLNGGAVIHGTLYTTGSNLDVDTGTEVIATVATSSYNAAFFDYYISSASNYRAGTVTSVWQPATANIEFTDVSTNDIGNTSGLVMSVDLLGSDARLKATVSTNNWVVKAAVRAL